MRAFVKFLIQSSKGNDILSVIAQEALEDRAPLTHLKDLYEYGCVSGTFSSLIYYHQTHAFFDTHYDEIEEMREIWEEEL